MRKLKLRREVVRNLSDSQLVDVRSGQIVTTAFSCTAPLQCLPTNGCAFVLKTLQGCTTAIDCP